MSCSFSQSLSSQSFNKQSIYCSTKRPLCLYYHFSLGRNQTPFSLTTDHPQQVVAELTQGANSSEAVRARPPCWGCVMSCESQWASKYPESPATRGSNRTGATGTVITRSPQDLAAPSGNLQPAAEHSINHQWPFPLPQLPAIQNACLKLKKLNQHYEYSATLLLKGHNAFLVLKFKTVPNSEEDALMLDTHLCGRRLKG